ncbi:MAG TPA: hypothetical protein VGD58_05360 [Herpetosiphonaceae bacterium]
MEQTAEQPQGEQSATEPKDGKSTIDLDALTAAVERLLRRDLEIANERLRGLNRIN